VLGVFQLVGLGPAHRLAFLQESEPYTALSFVEPNHLPHSSRAGAALPVSFRISNEEEGGRFYTWSIAVTGLDSVRYELAQGRAYVPAGHTRRVQVAVITPLVKGSVLLAVRLSSPAEAITLHLRIS
jgi:hypothetical protein